MGTIIGSLKFVINQNQLVRQLISRRFVKCDRLIKTQIRIIKVVTEHISLAIINDDHGYRNKRLQNIIHNVNTQAKLQR